MEVNAYEILNIDESANEYEIKRAFRRAVRLCHPDLGGIGEDFIQLQRAYSILMNEGLRNLLGKELLFTLSPKPKTDPTKGYDRRGRSKSLGIFNS